MVEKFSSLGPCASSAILTYVSPLSYVHKLGNLPDPSKNFLVKKLLTVHNRLHSAADVRLPITCSVLHHLVLALNHTNSSAFQRLFNKTMFLVVFYGFFCVGELMAKEANLRPLMHMEDLSFQTHNSCMTFATIVIKGFKHNTSGHPLSIISESAKDVELCPVNYLQQYFPLQGTALGPLFCFPDEAPVKTTYFKQQVCQTLIFGVLDSSCYKSHSFWKEAACWAPEKSLSDAQLCHLGCWESNAFKLYICQNPSFC